MKLKQLILAFLFVSTVNVLVAFGQQFKMSALPVTRSEFVDKLKRLKAEKPQATPAEFVNLANELVDKDGIPFTISFDAATCERLRKVKEQLKDPNAPLKLGAALKSVNAEGASLSLPEPRFAAKECGDCFVELPIIEVTDKDFITKVLGQNIKFHLPPNFLTNDALLLDADGNTIKRRWRIPFASVPIGVSHDENVIYLGFPEPDLSELSLAVFGEGVIQIATQAEAEASGKGTTHKDAFQSGASKLSKIKFEKWEKTFQIAFREPCAPAKP